MQIHVVKRGQSLYGIAQAYGTSFQSLALANEIPDPSHLVIGQALVIPIVGRYHWVQQGQSLWFISRMYGMDYRELAHFNRISVSSILRIGQRLYIPPQPKSTIDVLLYVEPRTPVNQTMINEVRNKIGSLTYLAMFSYRANRDGSLDAPSIENIPKIARSAGVVNALVVSNLEEYQFSADLAHAIFTDVSAQNRLFRNIIQIANDIGYKDIHFDFELLRAEDRELYNNFLRKARDRFKTAGLMLSTAIGPKTTDVTTGIYGAHEYTSQGSILDFNALLTYDWGYIYSTPQAVSPIGPVRNVVEHAVSVIPRNKILLGQNLYGYDWTAPYPPQGGPPAKALSPQQAIAIALRKNAQIEYDYQAQAPFFRYRDDIGGLHEVWFEDARSVQAKFDLIKQFNLRGIMYWKLGLSFPQNWLLLTDNFNIRKGTKVNK
ncbi:spore germination protein [Cytobacillus firmus]|uniref:Spore germination protein n=2 Tax=Cytobacillus TaxID=2675230 RepID=A0A366JIA4_CYTFI|nr:MULTISPECIES: LysM peptidoglycan-binding domain-containing protein [Cytobacillus]RBP86225.1 spore germination protein [Cytobacillus firmus]TDX35876.1 spore germination protein [Cytobacillus oceanisediminis]